jgi:hypothetical protein
MQRTATRRILHRVIYCMFSASIAAFALVSTAAQDTTPQQLEVDFWNSAQRVGTVESYKAYLDAFPVGFFSKLASAAIQQVTAASPAPQPASSPAVASSAVRALSMSDRDLISRIAGPRANSAVTFHLGDVFFGPGPLTVGRFGSRKQIVIPTGYWVVLAGYDHMSTHSTPFPMASLAFGKFEGAAIQSILIVDFNSRSGPTRSTWTEAVDCEKGTPSAPFSWSTPATNLRQCVTSEAIPHPRPPQEWTGSLWSAVRTALERMEITIAQGPMLRTDMFFTGDLGNYLKVSRFDHGAPLPTPEQGGASAVSSYEPSRTLEARRRWAQAYVQQAALGYQKNLRVADLQPGGASSTRAIMLPE